MLRPMPVRSWGLFESEEEDEDAVYQPEMIDFYGRKGAGGGESLAELARQLEPEPQP